MTEKAKQTYQPKAEISEVLLTRSRSRFVGVLRLLPILRSIRFHGWLLDRRAWREGVLSFKQRRRDETNQYHPTQKSPHENDWLPGNENPHGRTSGDEERLTIPAIILRKPRIRRLRKPAGIKRKGLLSTDISGSKFDLLLDAVVTGFDHCKIWRSLSGPSANDLLVFL